MLRVINHLTGDETTFEKGEDFDKLLEADKNTKGSVKWHAERSQRPHYSVYDGDQLVGAVYEGKPQKIARDPISPANPALQEDVEDLAGRVDTLGGTVAHLSQALDIVGSTVSGLQSRIDALEKTATASSKK